MKRRLAVIASHPIQYQGHWFRHMAARDDLQIEVFYGHRASPRDQADAGFGVDFEWDGPLLDGYASRFLKNVAATPSVSTFSGIDTPEIEEILTRGRFDAVLVSGWHTRAYVQAILAARKGRTPVMVRSDSHLHTPRRWLLRAAKSLPWRFFIRRMDACLAAGQWSRDYFIHYGANPRRVFVVPHTIDSTQTGCSPELRQRARERWNIPGDRVVFVMAGKLTALKRPLDFVRAIAKCAPRTRAFGVIAGDGPLRSEAENLALALNAPVRFTGFLNQSAIGAVYAAADALVLPSSTETWGLVVNEAMAWGRPCIVTDKVGCLPDLIESGRTGFSFSVGDVEQLAALMEGLAGSPSKLRQMSAAARERVAGQSPEVATNKLLEALHAVCK